MHALAWASFPDSNCNAALNPSTGPVVYATAQTDPKTNCTITISTTMIRVQPWTALLYKLQVVQAFQTSEPVIGDMHGRKSDQYKTIFDLESCPPCTQATTLSWCCGIAIPIHILAQPYNNSAHNNCAALCDIGVSPKSHTQAKPALCIVPIRWLPQRPIQILQQINAKPAPWLYSIVQCLCHHPDDHGGNCMDAGPQISHSPPPAL